MGITRCFGRVSSPVVLVGHSYGGTLITHAGTDDRVALVYIAALAPDDTETSQSQQQKFPVTDVFSRIEVADGRIWLSPGWDERLARDLPEAKQKVVWATQAVPVPGLFTQKLDGVAWMQVADQAVRLVLSGDGDAADAGVDRIGQRKIDDARFAAERDGRLGIVVRQLHEPAAPPAAQDDGHRMTGVRRRENRILEIAAEPHAAKGGVGTCRIRATPFLRASCLSKKS